MIIVQKKRVYGDFEGVKRNIQTAKKKMLHNGIEKCYSFIVIK